MKIFIQLKRERLDYWNLIHGDIAFNKILWLRLDSRSNLVIKICNISGEIVYPPILSSVNNCLSNVLLCCMQKVIMIVCNLIVLYKIIYT